MGDPKSAVVPESIPTGTVTFLFTDVEGSTRLWEQHPDDMRSALGRHDEIVRGAIETHRGYVFSLAGDQFVAAFHDVPSALDAAAAIQAAIATEPWPRFAPIRVRVGIHVGVAEERDNDYFGQVLNRTARIVSAAHGGQTLLSATAAPLAGEVELLDLGDHRLKDLAEAEHLWQVGSAPHPPLRTLQSVRHNLPVERTPLLGRANDVTSVATAVGAERLVTLLGIGGTGKTRLALGVAAELAERFADGVWFVDLVPTSDVDGVAEAAASAAGLRLSGGDLVEALCDEAASRELLFVFDNCEHVTDEAADVIDLLLERSDRVRVIATSREPLDLPDECQFRVEPLAVEATTESPAVQLFTASAARVRFEVHHDDVETVAEICAKLDGHPLSIELAAAQLRQLTLTELAGRLDHRFELLARGRSSRRRRRQASLLDVLDDSWQMLDDAERSLLAAIGVFPASFDVTDVEGLTTRLGIDTARVGRTLGGLRDRSLVSSDGRGRTRLLETVKLFVRERWDDPDRFVEAHTNWLLEHVRAEGADNDYQSASLAGWAMRHYDDHRAVEDRLAAAGRTVELAELIGMLRWAYSRETGQRANALLERVVRYHDELELSNAESAALHLAAAGAARAARDRHWLSHGASEAVRRYRLEGPSLELAVALIVESFSIVLKDSATAFANLDEASAIAHEVGADTLVMTTLAYRAHYAAMIGDVAGVREILADLEPRLDPNAIDNTTLMSLQAKMVAHLLDEPAVAVAAAEASMSLAATLGLDNDWWMHLYLATAAAANGDAQVMSEQLAAGEAMLRQSGTNGLPDLMLPYVALARVRGDDERARTWITAVRHAAGRPGTGVVIALYRLLRAEVGLADANPLESATIQEIHAGAAEWAAALSAAPA